MKRYQSFTLFVCFGILSVLSAQDPSKRTLAFYNVENLFDTQNDSLVWDDERTSKGNYRWTPERYAKKIDALAQVISEIGVQERGALPDIVGLCEIENAGVLHDIVNHPLLKPANYGVIHEDSPDERGMDVALLYDPKVFAPIAVTSIPLALRDASLRRDRTRDQLVVTGWLDETLIACIVNHWPSRRGGQTRSAPYRLQAAQLNRNLVDSLRNEHPGIMVFNMGDFNDNPTDQSMQYLLRPAAQVSTDLLNPMDFLYRKGYGTLAYRDQWSLFDQILVDLKLLEGAAQFTLYRVGIYTNPMLVTPDGRYKGYPLSTYSAGRYQGGFSDHFPVFIILEKVY